MSNRRYPTKAAPVGPHPLSMSQAALRNLKTQLANLRAKDKK